MWYAYCRSFVSITDEGEESVGLAPGDRGIPDLINDEELCLLQILENPRRPANTRLPPLSSQNRVLDLVDNAAYEYGLNYCDGNVAIRKDDRILIEANIKPLTNQIQVADNGGKRYLSTSA